jgi:hypothetical protein
VRGLIFGTSTSRIDRHGNGNIRLDATYNYFLAHNQLTRRVPRQRGRVRVADVVYKV